MKYCLKCNHLHNDTDNGCSYCDGLLAEITEDNTSVFLVSASDSKLEEIKNALAKSGISCEHKKNPIFNPDMPQDEDNNISSILVPYTDYEKAYEVCVKIGAIKDDEMQDMAEQFEEMSSAKRTTVRVISAILFILVVALAVYGTDAIMAIIKNLFI